MVMVCGGHNPCSYEAGKHASMFYAEVRKRTGDIAVIAKNTNFTYEQISLIKSHIFLAQHDLGENGQRRFFASYDIAESWRRLSSKDSSHIQPHDILLLKHEFAEIKFMYEGYDQSTAHVMATRLFDYATESDNFYRRQGFNM